MIDEHFARLRPRPLNSFESDILVNCVFEIRDRYEKLVERASKVKYINLDSTFFRPKDSLKNPSLKEYKRIRNIVKNTIRNGNNVLKFTKMFGNIKCVYIANFNNKSLFIKHDTECASLYRIYKNTTRDFFNVAVSKLGTSGKGMINPIIYDILRNL